MADMISIYQLLMYLVWLVCVVGIVGLVGYVASKVFLPKSLLNNVFISAFFWLFIGQLLISMLVSLAYTKGLTIQSGFLIVFAFLFYFSKNEDVQSVASPTTKLPWHLLLVSIFYFFVIACYSLFKLEGNGFAIVLPPSDYCFYAKLSHFLERGFAENEITAYSDFLPHVNNPLPYHYHELWLNVAVHINKRLDGFLTNFLVTMPLMQFTSLMGIIALQISIFPKSKPWVLVLLGMLLFYAGAFSHPSFDQIPILRPLYKAHYYLFSYTFQKFLPYSHILLASLLAWKFGRKDISICFFSLSMFITVVFLPVVLSTVFFANIFNRIWKFMDAKEMRTVTIISGICCLYFGVFYYLTSNADGARGGSFDVLLSLIGSKEYIIHSLKAVTKTVGYFIAFYAPVALAFYLVLRKRATSIIYQFMPLIFVTACSFVVYVCLIFELNGNQFYVNTTLVVFELMIITYVFAVVFQETQWWKKTVVVGIIVLSGCIHFTHDKQVRIEEDVYSSTYKNEVIKSIDEEGLTRGVFMRDTSYFSTAHGVYTHIYQPILFTAYTNPDFILYNINTKSDIKKFANPVEQHHNNGSAKLLFFELYLKNQNIQNPSSQAIDRERLSFIRKNNIRLFVIGYHEKIPSYLVNQVQRIISSEHANEKVLILKKWSS